MAILTVTEHWRDRSLSDTLSDGLTAARLFQVITDDPATSEATILAHDDIPQLGEYFPGSDSTKCYQRAVRREPEQRIEFWVSCDYKSKFDQQEKEAEEAPNPLDRKACITWRSQKVMKPLRMVKRSDYYSLYNISLEDTFKPRPDANSAGDFHEPTYEAPHTEWIAVITKNVASVPEWFLTYEDAVNDADFVLDFYGQRRTIKKGCGKLGAIQMPRSKTENGQEYVQLSFEIATRTPRDLREGEEHAPEPWDDEIPDQGMRVLISSSRPVDPDNPTETEVTKIWTNILDTNDVAISTPVPFNGRGTPVGTDGEPIPETSLKWSLYAPYPRKDFSILPLT